MIDNTKKNMCEFFFSNGHIQTIWASIFGQIILKKKLKIVFKRQRFKTPDNDFLDFDWLVNKKKIKKKPALSTFSRSGGFIE